MEEAGYGNVSWTVFVFAAYSVAAILLFLYSFAVIKHLRATNRSLVEEGFAKAEEE